VLKDASSVAADVSDIVLVGGSTRIPRIQEMLIEHFEVCFSGRFSDVLGLHL
jgi:molecular chaperone DnaK (HSP70)